MSRSLLPALTIIFAACTQEPPRRVERTFAPLSDEPTLTPASQAVAAHTAFRRWLDEFKQTPRPAPQRLVDQGRELSLFRKRHVVSLMLVEPRLALAMAPTIAERRMLPPEVQANVEQWRDGRGMLHVIDTVGDDSDGVQPPVEHFVTFDGRDTVLRAGVWGRREALLTRDGLRLHGIELDGVFAMDELPARHLTAEDVALFEVVGQCNAWTAAEVLHDGDSVIGFCRPEEADAYAQALIQDEASQVAADQETAASAWTEGPKTVLFMRVDFDDRPGEPVSLAAATTLINTNVNNFFIAGSFNKTQLSGTFPPTLRLPRLYGEYRDAGNYFQVLSDARVAARDAGFDPNNYNLDIVAHPNMFSGWAGRGYVGGKGTWLNGNFSQGVTAHELGHNYGNWHANLWNAGDSIIGAGSQQEYGNPFDVMGNSGSSHFNAWYKRNFDWILPHQIVTPTVSGTYRIHALDSAAPDGGLQAIKLPRPGDTRTRDYWLEFRQVITSNTSVMNGASFNFGWPSPGTTCPTTPPTACGAHLLDMTPGVGGASNSPLVIGRTFSDWPANLHFTPIGKGGTTPESLDVVINFGPYPSNVGPSLTVSASQTMVPSNTAVTFTATATDPNGDTLAYAWDFDDGTFSVNNQPTQVKTLTGNRVHQVRCTVSDMKGGTATAAIFVTVGTPTTFTLSGAVLMADAGVEGARISDGTRTTWSLSDGTWALTNVPASDAGYTLTAAKFDLAMTRTFAAPLVVQASQTDLIFTAANRPGYTVAGRVTAGGTGVSGVSVTDGTRTATTNANGDFSLTGVPNGQYTLSATRVGWAFALSGLRNPVEVYGGNVSNVNFVAQGQNISGQLPSTVMTAPVVTDGFRTVTATRGAMTQPWYYTLSGVPNGTWNVVATSPGVTLTPQNFTNPVTIAGAGLFNQNFQVATTTTFLVSGTVLTGATPLPGVSLSDGTRTATTDSFGRYTLVGVPAGTYTLTPTRAGYTFTPATRMTTVTSANITGQDFATTTVNAAPTIATAPAASQNPTTATTITLTVLGADDGGEANLTYAWSSTGPRAVTFSANGTNGAKSTQVTFTGAGTYTFEVTVTDAGGLPVRAQVVVVVNQVGTAMTVSPTTAAVPTGGTQFFSASGRDQFGGFMFLGAATWSVSGGGAIATNGQFTAGMTPGGPFTVTASAGGFMGTATITVVGNGAPTITQPARATPALVTGTSTALSVRATDDTGEPGLTYTWTATTAPAPVTFSANTSNAAKDSVVTFTQAGTYEFVVTVTDGAGNMVTSLVTVTVQAVPTTVEVQPATASVQVLATQQFDGVVDDQFGDALSVQPPLTFQVSGGGAIDATGLFTAGTMAGGPFTVTVSAGAATGTASVTVTMTPDPTPPTVQLTAPANNARVTGQVTLVAQAMDNVGVTRVEFFEGATRLGEATATPWQLQVDTTPWTPGTKTLTARAHDAAGNSATSTPVFIIVGMSTDTTPPTVSVTAPTAGAMTGLSVTLAATASDDVGVQRVEFEVDGAASGVATMAPYQVSATVSAGAHSLVAVAFDAAGNSTRSAPVAFTAIDPGTDGGSTTPDGGTTTPDAGQPEPDAGTQPGQDAGTSPTDAGSGQPVDAGTEPGPTGREGRQDLVLGGCGCNGVGVAPWGLAGLLFFVLRARRRG
ncbi:MAG: PKD domain-containing protein [Myxococcaceae bacterium]|nr:PKD domain-containing protein [Myxococcaceae bacterium]